MAASVLMFVYMETASVVKILALFGSAFLESTQRPRQWKRLPLHETMGQDLPVCLDVIKVIIKCLLDVGLGLVMAGP
eukprot:6225426-Ditylum_brightwellii.AAC.2